MLKFDVHVPEFRFELADPRAASHAMGQAVRERVVARLRAGLGAKGSLPRPKDGDAPAHETGTLARHIGSFDRVSRAGRHYAVVRAHGERPASEKAGQKALAAKARTRSLRAETRAALESRRAAGESIAAKYLSKRTGTFKLGSIRVRTAVDNAALAAILSVPAKDKRGKAGGRVVYRIFEASPEYGSIARRVAARFVRGELVGTGER